MIAMFVLGDGRFAAWGDGKLRHIPTTSVISILSGTASLLIGGPRGGYVRDIIDGKEKKNSGQQGNRKNKKSS